MDAMHAAIKKKRTGPALGLMSDEKPEPMAMEAKEQHSGGMHELVASLSDDQKKQLLSLLSKDAGGNSMDVAKGGPTSEEKSQINQKIAEQGAGEPTEETDMIMLGDAKRSAPAGKPRNLGERAMAAAKERMAGRHKG